MVLFLLLCLLLPTRRGRRRSSGGVAPSFLTTFTLTLLFLTFWLTALIFNFCHWLYCRFYPFVVSASLPSSSFFCSFCFFLLWLSYTPLLGCGTHFLASSSFGLAKRPVSCALLRPCAQYADSQVISRKAVAWLCFACSELLCRSTLTICCEGEMTRRDNDLAAVLPPEVPSGITDKERKD